MIGSIAALALLLGDASADPCRRPAHELVPVERVAPTFPVDGPRNGYVRDGDFVVLAVAVDGRGRPSRVDVVCTTGSPLLGRIAARSLWRWRFAPSGAPVDGQVTVTFRTAGVP